MGPNAPRYMERVFALLRAGGVPDQLAVIGFHLVTGPFKAHGSPCAISYGPCATTPPSWLCWLPPREQRESPSANVPGASSG
jgi:hypothetical protein